MLTLKELRNRMNSNEIQIDEAKNDLPAMLVLKRGTIRLLPMENDGLQNTIMLILDSILIFPMMFPKETNDEIDKQRT